MDKLPIPQHTHTHTLTHIMAPPPCPSSLITTSSLPFSPHLSPLHRPLSSPLPPPHPRIRHPLPRKRPLPTQETTKMVVRMSSKHNNSDGISFGDWLLDYIEGGPKLRKWYGASDQLPKDGGKGGYIEDEEQLQEQVNEVQDAVLVTDADSETGQLIVLSLILKRARIRALVKDAKAATAAFGSYVQPVVGDVANKDSIMKALRGVRAIICPLRVGALTNAGILRGVEHFIFLSQLALYRNTGGLAAFLSGKARRQAEEDEAAVASLGVPYTIIRSASLRDEPGGQRGFNFNEGSAVKGTISREDVATICVKALDAPPQQALIFEVANGDDEVNDWEVRFRSL